MEAIDGKRVKYISIELVLHPDKLEGAEGSVEDLIQYGIFKGIRKAGNKQEFLLVSPPKDKSVSNLASEKEMKAFAWDAYNVLSFEVFDGSVRHIVFFKADDEDQKEADRIILKVMANMRLAGRMTKDDDIIDVSTYSNLPGSFTDTVRSTVNNMNGRTTLAQKSIPATTHQGWAGHQTKTVDYSRKPFFFRRKSKLPHHATLKKLSTLLDKIASGDYIEPAWPEIPKEIAEMEAEEETTKDTHAGFQTA